MYDAIANDNATSASSAALCSDKNTPYVLADHATKTDFTLCLCHFEKRQLIHQIGQSFNQNHKPEAELPAAENTDWLLL